MARHDGFLAGDAGGDRMAKVAPLAFGHPTALAADITAVGGTVLPVPADVTGRAAVQDAADQVAER